ncbi:dihydrofolate reductase family protein [Sphingomonas sp. MMSM20]|uniref:dihydrofolate reductase family protein n=1 Tax=Sphingomonas lycopersici TaxID=2951807 RepID=UPI0022370385|nr:dihydrofolate reductase family protein [Sphingomonas lycopersici]MCW6531657.1 dihydrofolate reductase family protein [Sphingomonas lycopersici]
MRKITGGVFQSLDGVIQAPGGPTEDWTGGFTLGGWSATFWDDAMGAAMGGLFSGAFDLLLGRKTWEIFAAHWPYVGADNPMGALFDGVNKYVVTRGNDPLEWQNSHRVGSIDEIARLKQGDGPELLIQGSSTLYPALFAAGLVDRLFVMTFPVVLGSGKKLFGAGTPPFALKLIGQSVSTTGVTIATYEPDGAVPIGDFQLDAPSPREKARQERMKREG